MSERGRLEPRITVETAFRITAKNGYVVCQREPEKTGGKIILRPVAKSTKTVKSDRWQTREHLISRRNSRRVRQLLQPSFSVLFAFSAVSSNFSFQNPSEEHGSRDQRKMLTRRPQRLQRSRCLIVPTPSEFPGVESAGNSTLDRRGLLPAGFGGEGGTEDGYQALRIRHGAGPGIAGF